MRERGHEGRMEGNKEERMGCGEEGMMGRREGGNARMSV